MGNISSTCLDVKVLLDEGRGNDGVDIVNSLGHTLTTPLGLVAISVILLLFLFVCVAGSC